MRRAIRNFGEIGDIFGDKQKTDIISRFMFQHCFKMVFTLKVTITMIQASMFQIKQLQKNNYS